MGEGVRYLNLPGFAVELVERIPDTVSVDGACWPDRRVASDLN